MSTYLLRRPRLGRTSAKEIRKASRLIKRVWRHDRRMPRDVTAIIRWGCTASIPEGVRVYQTAQAIHEVGDKSGFRKKITELDPFLSPYTFFDVAEARYPCVVRPAVHAQGRRLWLCNNEGELHSAIALAGGGWYASVYIPKVAEYRVTLVQGRIVWIARKTPANPEAVAWNVAQGGRFDNVSWQAWPIRVCEAAVRAFTLTSLEFGAVDIMVDSEGVPYVLEINSAPSQTSPYRQLCMAKAFDWMLEGQEVPAPKHLKRNKYQGYIHPAIKEKSIE